MRKVKLRMLTRRVAAACLAGLLVVGIAATASANHGEPATGETEPGALGADNSGGKLSTDTELTPVAKEGGSAGWSQVAGSRWQQDGSITQMAARSPTPYDLDFYGTDFLDKKNGFAVGAQCRREDPNEPVAEEEVAGCDRIPVIYRYREDPQRGPLWEESYRGSDSDDPGGFIAAVTWLGADRALAVGGTGTYPRREPGCVTGTPECPDPAGMARAWLFSGGAWEEITDLPSEMRALQAVDTDGALAIAGGMRQIWHFEGGRFTDGFGPELNGGAGLENASHFRFRVRDIRGARAVTAGCCAAQRFDDRPAILTRSGAGWRASPGGASYYRPDVSCPPAPIGGCADVPALDPVEEGVKPAWETKEGAEREVGPLNPDSYYALYGAVAIRTAGGPPSRYATREPPSRLTLTPGWGSCDDEVCAAERTLAPGKSLVPHVSRLVSAPIVWACGPLRSRRWR